MRPPDISLLACLCSFACVAACGEDPPAQPADDGGTSGGIDVTGSGGDGMMPKLDLPDANDETSGPVGCAGDGGGNNCGNRLDLLFVIDNSGSMGEEQLNLATNLPGLVRALEDLEDAEGIPVNADVHIMVTTTDSGNVLCDPFYRPGRSPESGAAVDTPCTERLDRFESIAMPPVNAEEACNAVCPTPIGPEAPFIAFSANGSNVPGGDAVDVDGDGMPDSTIAQALACIGPQGIDGCGYESPLDSMMHALDPEAPHNQGADPFLRSGGVLAVAIVTDEADCSVIDDAVMTEDTYHATNPETMSKVPSSALCWNAGVTCEGPDGDGVYGNCEAAAGQGLRDIQEYVDVLNGQGRPVVMLGILGVPPVTARNPDPPFQPTEGGVSQLVYRDWRDPDFDNGGDVLPDDWAAGRNAAHKAWQFGIGPGCTGQTDTGEFTGQAVPPVRVKEVCQALDAGDDVRCCIESICDTDFTGALNCLAGLVSENVIPVG